MKRRALLAGAIIALALLLFGAWFTYAHPEEVLGLGGTELGSSLSREVGAATGACSKQRGRDWWWCYVEDDPGSGASRSFRLVSDEEGCWTAHAARVEVVERTPGKAEPEVVRVVARPRTFRGCATISDYVSPHDPYGGAAPGQLPLAPAKRAE